MEKKFKKLLQKSQDTTDPLFRTFEGALFSESSWYLHSEETEFLMELADAQKIEKLKALDSIKENSSFYLSEVLFLGDNFIGEGEDLLGKMISAMKLKGSEFSRFPLAEELDDIADLSKNLEDPSMETKELMEIIKEKRPKVVVTLGATITNILLGKREKLSTIHGQFFEKSLGDCNYTLMPIFHPDFLTINPNMKRTAWIDLQKVMERIGKI